MNSTTRSDGLTLVLGGTGKTGRRVAERLASRGVPTRVASRAGDPPFDWGDQNTWDAVLGGVTAAYISYAPDLAIPGATDVIRDFIERAVERGIRRLVLLSGRGEEEAQRCEQVIQRPDIEWTVVRASWFYQNFSEGAFFDMVLAGEVALPAGEVGEPFVDADDIADVAVAALTEDGHAGQAYELTGPQLLTFAEAVDEIARAAGRTIRYVQIPPEAFASGVAEMGLPEDLAWLLDYLFATVLDGRNAHLNDGVRRALGRAPGNFAEYARRTAASLDLINIEVSYLGAAPEEVEEAVCVRIEEAIVGLDGIEQITSTASEGMGSVLVEIELGADVRRVLDDIKGRIDAIDTFPDETEKPIIRELIASNQVIDLAVSGHVDEFALKAAADRIRDELSTIPEISLVEVTSARPYEISIEVSESTLRRHGLTFDDVANAVRRSSLDLPGGSVRSESGEILLRTIGQAYRGTEYENLVLLTRRDGTRLLLGEVATVVDGFAENDQFARFDAEPAVLISVLRTGDQGATEIARRVHEYVERTQSTLPEGISLTIWQDAARELSAQLSLMLRNGLTGFVLVFLLLALFLELRLAFWVSLGIPISFLGAIMLMPMLDVTVNVMSLFAFLLVLGIIVDDAIIVGENIYSHQERHGDGLRGAIEGAKEIATPVIFSVLTTVAAFMPLMFVPGMMGKIFRVIPLIVIPGLLFSLVESLDILPAHLSHIPKGGATRPLAPFPAAVREWPDAVHPPRIQAESRVRPAVAVSDGGSRAVDADSDRRHGARRVDEFPLLSVDRGRLHGRLNHDAVRHTGHSDLRRGAQARGGRRTSQTRTTGGDRAGLLPTRLRVGRRPADGVSSGRADRASPEPVGLARRRGHDRARAVAAACL